MNCVEALNNFNFFNEAILQFFAQYSINRFIDLMFDLKNQDIEQHKRLEILNKIL